jgi:hypothetical protein
MRNTHGRLASLVRTAAVLAVALGLATPAAAQFGLKKKLKQAAGQAGANKAAEAAGATPEAAPAEDATATGARGGAVVLTDDVVKKLVDGLKAARAEREAAEKEDTPYGRYKQQEVAYASAKGKCEAAQAAWPQRAADEKVANKYTAMVDKMMKAQERGDMKLYAIYGDSALAIMDPSCTVKQPTQPDKYYDMQRELDERAEKAEMKSSGLNRSELSMAKERTDAILRNAAGPDVSASEKSAVNSKAGELKRLMGYEEPATARVAKPAPAPTPPPAAAAGPTMTPGQSAMANCMAQNAQKHKKEMEELANRAEAAEKAGDTATMMAIADSLNQIQMAGCTAGQ